MPFAPASRAHSLLRVLTVPQLAPPTTPTAPGLARSHRQTVLALPHPLHATTQFGGRRCRGPSRRGTGRTRAGPSSPPATALRSSLSAPVAAAGSVSSRSATLQPSA